jgi:hypothetical protein
VSSTPPEPGAGEPAPATAAGAAPDDRPTVPLRHYPYAPESNVVRKRSVANVVGLALAGVAVMIGISVVGGVIMVLVMLNNLGSNK